MFNKLLLIITTITLLNGCDSGPTPPDIEPVICTAVLTWEYPIAMLDGTLLPREDLEKLTIYVNEASGYNQETIEMVEDIMDVNIITWEVKQLSQGVHWFYLTVTTVKDTVESGYSNEKTKAC